MAEGEHPAYVEVHGAAYMLCWNWLGKQIYLLHSLHVDKQRPVYYPLGGLPAHHTVITRQRAAEMHAATLAEFDRTHTPHLNPGRHPDA